MKPARCVQSIGGLELAPAAGEVLVELAPHRVEPLWRLEHARRHARREVLEHLVGGAVLGVGHAHEPARGRRDHERPERRIDRRVGDVDEPLRFGARADVRRRGRQFGGRTAQHGLDIAHWLNSSFSLFSPSWTFRRAASSEEFEQRRQLRIRHPEHAAAEDRRPLLRGQLADVLPQLREAILNELLAPRARAAQPQAAPAGRVPGVRPSPCCGRCAGARRAGCPHCAGAGTRAAPRSRSPGTRRPRRSGRRLRPGSGRRRPGARRAGPGRAAASHSQERHGGSCREI